MSVPRPAMFVAIVTAPGWPAPATISASRWWYFAFSTLCCSPARLNSFASVSDASTLVVPMSTGIAELVQPARLLDDRVVLLAARLVDEIVPVVADHRPVRRDDRDLELVDLEELRLFRLGRTGHAGQLVVHAEVVLDGDRRHRLRLALDANAFLGLDRLVQPLRPATARHRAAGELVDDQHLAVLHDVVHVASRTARARAAAGARCSAARSSTRTRSRAGGAPRSSASARQLVIVIDPMHFLRQVGQHERVVLVGRHEVDAAVGEVHRVALLVEHEQQVVLDVAVRLLARAAAGDRRCDRAPSSARAACCPAPAAPSSAAGSSGCPSCAL